MKKRIKLLLLLILPVLLFTGCLRDQLVYENAKIKLTFNVNEDYKLTEDSKYFRTAREKTILIGSNFKIGVEFSDALVTEKIKFKDFMKKYEKEEDFKKVEYSGMDGFQFYTPSYLRYEIYLPLEEDLILRLNIYSANDNKKATTKVLNSDEVQDIIDNIDVEIKNK